MQLGILGLPKAGKTTLFNTLTASQQATGKFAASAADPHRRRDGPRPAPRRSCATSSSRRSTRRRRSSTSTSPASSAARAPESLDLAKLKTVDALVHVVRAFEDPEILHPTGSVDPARDVASSTSSWSSPTTTWSSGASSGSSRRPSAA